MFSKIKKLLINPKDRSPFITATSIGAILEHSQKEPVLIFKHSVTCPVSGRAHGRVTKGISSGEVKYPMYLVVVQKQRQLSSTVAKELDVIHESPQLIFVSKGEVVNSMSHGGIQIKDIPVL